ncbi:hypothetical protein Nepgr_033844 [Nepenthes gracilis]|uniref:Uncharacterized protein n=1 Tax=Nepenthes gracilis TaxID=150966 RepID=A0AAD3TL56_NEPGR|nr:hypothetical protein Nepgr_033844 [Nepenthes gracilis]
MKKQGTRHQLPPSTAPGFSTFPSAVVETGIIRNQIPPQYAATRLKAQQPKQYFSHLEPRPQPANYYIPAVPQLISSWGSPAESATASISNYQPSKIYGPAPTATHTGASTYQSIPAKCSRRKKCSKTTTPISSI